MIINKSGLELIYSHMKLNKYARKSFSSGLTRSKLYEVLSSQHEKIFYNTKTDSPLESSLQFTKVRTNFFFVNSWLIKHSILKDNSANLFGKAYSVYFLHKYIRLIIRKKLQYHFVDYYNQQVIDELNRNANAIFVSLSDLYESNIMRRNLSRIIVEEVLCEKFSEGDESVARFTKYITSLLQKPKLVDYFENEFDLNKF